MTRASAQVERRRDKVGNLEAPGTAGAGGAVFVGISSSGRKRWGEGGRRRVWGKGLGGGRAALHAVFVSHPAPKFLNP